MIYKEFIADAAKVIMAEAVSSMNAQEMTADNDVLKQYAKGSVAAAKLLAEELDADFNNEPVDGGLKRYAENETFFDNYVNWTKTK